MLSNIAFRLPLALAFALAMFASADTETMMVYFKATDAFASVIVLDPNATFPSAGDRLAANFPIYKDSAFAQPIGSNIGVCTLLGTDGTLYCTEGFSISTGTSMPLTGDVEAVGSGYLFGTTALKIVAGTGDFEDEIGTVTISAFNTSTTSGFQAVVELDD